MVSPANVVTSRRRQHELLRSWAGWPLTSVLIDPAEVAQVRDAGWSGTHHNDPKTGEQIVDVTDGLGFGVDDSWHHHVEVIPWSEVEAIARPVPAEDVSSSRRGLVPPTLCTFGSGEAAARPKVIAYRPRGLGR